MTEQTHALDPQAAARLGDDLALLARLHDREIDAGIIAGMRAAPVAEWFALKLSGETFEQAARLIDQALAAAPDPISWAALDDLAAEYAALYLNHTYRISPYESVWTDEDGLERQEPMFAVRKWFARFGYRAPDWRMRGDDHIAHELALLARVAPKLADADTAFALGQFMREHLLVWAPAFAARVARRCGSPLYAGIALLTVAYLAALSAVLEQVHGLDMAPVEPERPSQVRPGPGASCADPPPRYAPGAGPGW